MKTTRRMRRLARIRMKDNKMTVLSLVALMDMFTNLVFFLLASQGATHIAEPKKDIALPDSYVEEKARPSVVIMVSAQTVLVDGDPLVTIDDLVATKEDSIAPIRERLLQIKSRVIGLNAQTAAQTDEVTILAHKELPFKVMKKLMSTCAAAGYSRISLAVNHKTAPT